MIVKMIWDVLGKSMRLQLLILLLCLLVSACTQNDTPIVEPTKADPDAVRTAIVKTQNAPPAGFESVGFNPIDFNRDQLPSSYFEITVNFEGQYTQTGEDTSASLKMQVWENGVRRARRVKLSFIGDALSGGVTNVEAVRFENDFYLLDSNAICTINSDAAHDIATLTAGEIVGGVTLAIPTGIIGDVNGQDGYQYGFGEADLKINIFQADPSVIDVVGGEMWVVPSFNVVGRFGVSLNTHNARILFGTQPVTGALRYEYNLLTIGDDTPIALPNGC
jgi:hypothetical protein